MARTPDAIPEASLRLLLAPGVGPATIRRLRAHFPSDDAAATASTRALSEIDGIGQRTAEALRRSLDEIDPARELHLMAEHHVALILHGDDDYPPLLAAIADAPAGLWIRGTLEESDRLALAVVGSRRCTAYGREQAGRFAALLAQSGLTIVSGGALGIDGESHRGALRVGGRTIAVLGCGLARSYPQQHAELFDRIASEGGAVVSEYPMDTEPRREHFPRRNRIISGLSLGTLVIEAGQGSGALITARLAAETHGREVMAVPGRVDSPASAGCLAAIRDGWAALVRHHADVLNQLDASSHLVRGALEAAGHADARSSATLFDANLTQGQQRIIEVIADAGQRLHLDQIAARTQLPLSQIMADLTLLQIRGRVEKDHRGVSLKH